MASSSYPSAQQVERANLHQLVSWWRYLQSPGTWAIDQDDRAVFQKAMEEEAAIMERIGERIKELGGITPSVSKAVGWDRRSSMTGIPDNIMKQFFGLANQLSPENLSCDGECSRSQVQVRYRQIMREWQKLERRVGRRVTQEEVETEQFKSYRRGSMNDMIAARELMAAAKLLAMDFPSQDSMDKYLKDHPDADKAKHKVVKHDPSNPETHPANLMRQRKNEEKMKEIGKHFKKDPKDVSVDEIVEFNQKGKRKTVWDEMTPKQRSEAESKDRQDAKEKAKKACASEMLAVARDLLGLTIQRTSPPHKISQKAWDYLEDYFVNSWGEGDEETDDTDFLVQSTGLNRFQIRNLFTKFNEYIHKYGVSAFDNVEEFLSEHFTT